MGIKRIPVTDTKRIVGIIAEDFPDNVTDACEYMDAGGQTNRCIAGQALSLMGVSDGLLGELEGIVQHVIYDIEEKAGLSLSPASVAYLRAAQAYQDGDNTASEHAAETDLAFTPGKRQPWASAHAFAERYYQNWMGDLND